MVFRSLAMALITTGIMFVVPVGAVAGTALWTRRVARRASTPRWAVWTARWLVAITVLLILWAGATFAQRLVSTLGSEALSPPDRQRLLAAGIAEAFYRGVLALGSTLVGTVWLGVCTVVWGRRRL